MLRGALGRTVCVGGFGLVSPWCLSGLFIMGGEVCVMLVGE